MLSPLLPSRTGLARVSAARAASASSGPRMMLPLAPFAGERCWRPPSRGRRFWWEGLVACESITLPHSLGCLSSGARLLAKVSRGGNVGVLSTRARTPVRARSCFFGLVPGAFGVINQTGQDRITGMEILQSKRDRIDLDVISSVERVVQQGYTR